MTWIEDIRRMATDHDGEVSRQWLENSRKETPYCVLPALLYLKRCGVKGNEDVLAQLAIIHPDRHALALMLGEDATAFSAFTQLEKLKNLLNSKPAVEELGKRVYESIGIKNINSRIQLYYGTMYGLDVDSVENEGTTALITVPRKQERKQNV